MECRLGEFVASTHSLDRALEVCPTYDRAREVRDLSLVAKSRTNSTLNNQKRPPCLVHVDRQNTPDVGGYSEVTCIWIVMINRSLKAIFLPNRLLSY